MTPPRRFRPLLWPSVVGLVVLLTLLISRTFSHTSDTGTTVDQQPVLPTASQSRDTLPVHRESAILPSDSLRGNSDEKPVDATSPKAALASQRERLDAFATRLTQEPRDVAWSSKTEGLLAQAFSPSDTPGTTLLSSLCKSTICKVTVSHDDLEAQQALAHTRFAKEPFASAASVYYSYERQGTPTTTLYVMRSDTTTPHTL
jgi:hypothetical protein